MAVRVFILGVDGSRKGLRRLLEKGVLRTIHGDQRFAEYLAIEPTGMYAKSSCDNAGTASFEDFRKKPVIWPVMFSSFDVDIMSGDFSFDIRIVSKA